MATVNAKPVFQPNSNSEAAAGSRAAATRAIKNPPIGFPKGDPRGMDQNGNHVGAGHFGNIGPPDSPVKGQVSDYMGYGSYSGADIKVIVHIPKSLKKKRELEKAVEDIRQKVEDDTKAIEKGYAKYRKNPDAIETSDLLAINDLEDGLGILTEELLKAESDLKSFLEMPVTQTLAELQSISWSIYREKSPVRPIGSVYPRAYTRGPRPIAGTMVFTVFYKHVFHELLEGNHLVYSTGARDVDEQQNTPTLPDQLPPMDISLQFANEYGAISYMGLYGVEFIQDGGTFSIEDILSENVVQYVARDLDPISATQFSTRNAQGPTGMWTTSVSGLMSGDTESIYTTEKRRNPFI
jgi:hypothetical protein